MTRAREPRTISPPPPLPFSLKGERRPSNIYSLLQPVFFALLQRLISATAAPGAVLFKFASILLSFIASHFWLASRLKLNLQRPRKNAAPYNFYMHSFKSKAPLVQTKVTLTKQMQF